MAGNDVLKRARDAFERDVVICSRCQLGLKEYWSVLAMMHEQTMPEAGKELTGYAFAPTPAMISRVPMCRSGAATCEGMRSVLRLKFGEPRAVEIAAAFEPLVLQ